MIKMTIGGEEVVSNKEFTINEEMLSASSTILNNCYPKSWEDNKDYTSNFYYPKDYSKFLLGEGEFLHGISEYSVLTVSGEEFIQFETNVEKEWNSLNVYGNTYQETRSGKNLLIIPDGTYMSGANEITAIINGGIITLNGTTTGNRFVSIPFDYTFEAGTYNLSKNNAVANANITVRFDGSILSQSCSNVNAKKTETFTESTTVSYFVIRIASGTTLDNFVIKPQLEKGTESTSWEQGGVQPSPEFPSELVSVGYENLFNFEETSSSGGGLNSTIKGTNLTVEGTATSGSKNITGLLPNPYKAGDYVFSITEALPRPLILRFYDNNNATIRSATIPTGSTHIPFILDGTETQYRLIFNPTSGNSYNFEIDLMLTKGMEIYSYIPYGKYGIEIKNVNKNLFTGLIKGIGLNSSTGAETINANAGTSDFIEVDFNTNQNYYLSGLTNTIRSYVAAYNSNKQFLGRTGATRTTQWGLTSTSFTSGTPQGTGDIAYLRVTQYAGSGDTGTIDDIDNLTIQLETGNTNTTYIEHKENSQSYILDAPLRAIGDYKDRLFIQDGVLYVERNIKSVVLNGSEDWKLQKAKTISTYFHLYDYVFVPVAASSLPQAFCSHFTANTGNHLNADEIEGFTFNTGAALRISVFNTIASTVSELQTWLSSNNIEVQYVLNEPTITPIGYVNIPNAYEGQNTTYLYTGLATTMDVLYYWKNFNVLFAGVVKNTGDISLNPRYPHYCNLQILDYKTFLSESNTLDFVIANKTIREAITMVVNAVSGYGFVLGEININSANDIIGAYSTLNKTAYDVLQYLANISGSRWRARYVDSSTMAIDFYDPNTLPQGANIEYTQQYWEDNNIVDLTFNYGTRDYRNKQILLSDEVYANINYNESLISNGYSNTFTLQNNVGTIVNILIGNEEKTFATTNDKQMGVDADFYYAPGKNILESNSIYSAGTLIKITYQPLVKGRQIVYNSSEVERISEQTDTEGIIARYENRNDILSSDELEKIAQTYIEYKGKAEVILTLTTRNKDLYNIGEVVYFDAPIPDLAQNYMVKTKKTEYIVIDEIVNLFYIYEMTSSFNSEKAINYFDNQRNKANGNISSGDTITRNIDIETDVNIIWNNGSISSASITINGDNELNSILNSPFID